MVPEYDLIPTPAPVSLSHRPVYLNCFEPGAVKLVYEAWLAHYADFAIAVFENRSDAGSVETVRLVVACQSAQDKLHCAGGFGSQPEIAIPVFGHCGYVYIAQTIRHRITAESAVAITTQELA